MADHPRRSLSNWASLLIATGAAVPWAWCAATGIDLPHPVTALLAGVAILGAAFLLSWVVEVAEIDVPPSVAVSVLALLAVLPEYAVDATFAWKAGRDPSQAGYAVANMTGANRLLLGIGWSTMVALAWFRHKKTAIRLPGEAGLDIGVLAVASLYALVPVATGRITLIDTVVFVGLYGAYVVAALRTQSEGRGEDEDLVGPADLIASFSTGIRRLLVVVFTAWAGVAIYLSAEPFADALVHAGLGWGIDEFLLVQWVAPLASEAPEFSVAALMVLRGRMAKGMMVLVSSKVNQWTLLVGTLPVVTSFSVGGPSSLPLDLRQREEVLLTAAQSLFGVATIANLLLERWQAALLAGLFLVQMAIPGTTGRFIFAAAYLVAATGIVVFHGPSRRGLLDSLRTFWFSLVRGQFVPVVGDPREG